MAYGRLAWDEDKFLNASISYFFKALKGFNDLEHERDKGHWERLRLLGSWVISPYVKKGENITPIKLLPLPWDKAFVAEKAEEWLKRNEKYNVAWENLSKVKNVHDKTKRT